MRGWRGFFSGQTTEEWNVMNELLPAKPFLVLPYDELEELNLGARAKRDTVSPEEQEEEYRAYLEKEKRIKAVTLCFSDIEGRFHMLDYDKKFLLASADNLTFDGSSRSEERRVGKEC